MVTDTLTDQAARVVSIGHGVKEIREAMLKQADRISFAHPILPVKPQSNALHK